MRVIVWILLLGACMWPRSEGEGSSGQIPFTMSEGELRNSHLWRQHLLKLFILEEGE